MRLRQVDEAREVCLGLEKGQLRIMTAASQHLVTKLDEKGHKAQT